MNLVRPQGGFSLLPRVLLICAVWGFAFLVGPPLQNRIRVALPLSTFVMTLFVDAVTRRIRVD